MTPYYQDEYAVVYHGDCREILPTLPKADLVLTDPPYGIGMDGGNVGYKGFNNFKKMAWDKAPPSQGALLDVAGHASQAIIWGGNYFALPASRCWLVWDKGEGFKGRTYAEAELAWTNMDANVRVMKHDPLAKGDYKGKHHPTMKPLKVILWCISLCPDEPQTILDPFMGSGTTLVAAKLLNRKAWGIEICEQYCEIAAKRLSQGVLPLWEES